MDINYLKTRLLEEKRTLESELSRLGVRMTEDRTEWLATEAPPSDLGEDLGENKAEETEIADQIEDFEERTAEERTLGRRYRDVLDALRRIDAGDFGVCVTGGQKHPIEEERLEANPAASTCTRHM